MNNSPVKNTVDLQDEIDIRPLIEAILNNKWKILGFALFSACLSGIYAFVVPEIFRSEMTLQIRDAETGALGGAGGIASQLGGIAGLAGISLGSSESQDVALATLKSRQLIQTFITEKKLLPELFASRWDEQTKTWRLKPWQEEPTPWAAYEKPFLSDILAIDQNKKDGLVTVAIEWTDPAEAQQWVTELVIRANALLREKAIARTEKNLQYLSDLLTQTSTVELQQSLFRTIEDEQKKLMVAKASDDYAFQIVDPAFVPEFRSRPKRLLLIVLGAFAGLFFGATFILFRANS